ncbi:MAG: antitoxin [Bryobacteraceae bacterium]|jgi:hypothetical protein
MQAVVNLDPDVEEMLRRKALERNLDFDRAINETLRAGLSSESVETGRRFVQTTYSCGPALVDLTKGLALADELEDEETIRKMRLSGSR